MKGAKKVLFIFSLLILIFFTSSNKLEAGVGNVMKNGDFTSLSSFSYTQSKDIEFADMKWNASTCQLAGGVFYLGCNDRNAELGFLNSNYSLEIDALKKVDKKYTDETKQNAYALVSTNEITNASKVTINWNGGNNAFQVYLLVDFGSGYETTEGNYGYTNYTTSGATISGNVSVEFNSSKTIKKIALIVRPGLPNSQATNKTIRISTYEINSWVEGTTCKVNFISNGVKYTDEIKVNSNDLIKNIEEPKMQKYVFMGWYTEEEYINKWNFDTDKVTEDLILYAKWEKEKFLNTDYISLNINNLFTGGTYREYTYTEKNITFVSNNGQKYANEIRGQKDTFILYNTTSCARIRSITINQTSKAKFTVKYGTKLNELSDIDSSYITGTDTLLIDFSNVEAFYFQISAPTETVYASSIDIEFVPTIIGAQSNEKIINNSVDVRLIGTINSRLITDYTTDFGFFVKISDKEEVKYNSMYLLNSLSVKSNQFNPLDKGYNYLFTYVLNNVNTGQVFEVSSYITDNLGFTYRSEIKTYIVNNDGTISIIK